MRERPILFSAPMVRAILEGRKTQTRLVMKHQPQRVIVPGLGPMLAIQQPRGENRWLWPNARDEIIASCPYGAPGDRLWVRETWGLHQQQFDHECHDVIYRADDQRPSVDRWRPSIHMPRWASRIDLEVTGVRVERLQDISSDDATAEGWPHVATGGVGAPLAEAYPIGWFANLWESINGAGSWNANPWVWAVEFRLVASEASSP